MGNLIGPQTFRANQAPAYTGGVVAMLVSYCVCIGLIGSYWFLCVVLNRRIVPAAPAVEVAGAVVEEFSDLTDFKQEGFKYIT